MSVLTKIIHKLYYSVGIGLMSMVSISIQAQMNPATIVTAPIDSRPISIDYLEDLAALSGDQLILPDKSHLDCFSDKEEALNHFADSRAVRQDVWNAVCQAAGEDTTVIINTSSYLTNGLVGSRCAENYSDIEQGMAELNLLTTEYPQPYYYINVTMPRTLPESRNHTIWPNEKKVQGLGHYYLKYQTVSNEETQFIERQFDQVTPEQFLLEWAYVQGKADELGESQLTQWEREFLSNFNNGYLNSTSYSQYIQDYQAIYEKTAGVMKQLIDMETNGQIDELVISVDDFQLPTFIEHMYKQSTLDKQWIPTQSHNPIKFSLVRSYLQTRMDSVYNYEVAKRGQAAHVQATEGEDAQLNYIYGVDEVPQMIYARDLARRTQQTVQFEPFRFNNQLANESLMYGVGSYDMAPTTELLEDDKHFITHGGASALTPIAKPYTFFVNKYTATSQQMNDQEIVESVSGLLSAYNQNKNVGLIELYNANGSEETNTALLKTICTPEILAKLGLADFSVSQLQTYSAWNTEANAIGLGLAHAQVFGIAENLCTDADREQVCMKQSKILVRHLLEDGIYGGMLKSHWNDIVSQEASANGISEEELLRRKLGAANLLSQFVDQPIRIGEGHALLKKAYLTQCSFPWHRNFECYLEVTFEAEG